MKKKLLRLCSIVLVISMVLGNVVSLAADDATATGTENVETTGMTFSENLKGVIDKPFDSSIKTVEATICLPTGNQSVENNILATSSSGHLPNMSFKITHAGYPAFYYNYSDNGKNTAVTTLFNTTVNTGKVTHVAFVLEDNAETNTTTVSCYVDGVNIEMHSSTSYSQPSCLVETPSNDAFVVGGNYSTANTGYFKGEIYSLAVYSDARTADEIAGDMESVDTSTDNTDLMVYYDLTTVTDATTDLKNRSENDTDNAYGLNIVETWMDERKPALEDWNKENGDYTIALIGDTQIATEYDVKNGKTDGTGVVSGIYNWLLENKDEKNIQFVVGLGDIVQGEDTYALDTSIEKTDEDKRTEWEYAMDQIRTLDGEIPYSLIRGNHDNQALYNEYVTYEDYEGVVDGALDDTMLNTWQELVVDDIKYLILSLDLGASDTELAWAEEVIKTHPNHNVIITTHAYLNDDGTTLDANDAYYPSQYPSAAYPNAANNRNNGDEMWENYFSKYDNIVMIVSGHIGTDDVVMTQATGDNGNTVAQLLVNPQDLDYKLAKSSDTSRNTPTGMICLLHFSADGKTVQVEQYSTHYDQYYMRTSQFTFELDVVKEQKVLFNTQQMTVGGTRQFSYSNSHCATNNSQVILSAGYTNVISYVAPSDGLIKITDMSVKFHGELTNTTSEIYQVTSGSKAGKIEFAVTNAEGKILSNRGEVLTLDASQASVTGLSTETQEIEKGDSIYFVFHSIEGTTNIIDCIPKIEFSDDNGENWEIVSRIASGYCVPWPSDTTYTGSNYTQGMGGFYYHYSKSYEVTNYKENDSKLILNTKEMSTDYSTYPFYSSETGCWLYLPQIITTSGNANVISYQAEEDGTIWIDSMKVWMATNADGYKANFAVIDEEGEILTNNGEMYSVNSYYVAGDNDAAYNGALTAAKDLIVTKQEIKKGERIYFVFQGVVGTTSLRCQADIEFCAEGETVGERKNPDQAMSLCASGATNDTLEQGSGNFYYEYSSVCEIVSRQEPEYIYIDSKDMAAETDTNSGFPFMYDNYDCMTSPSEIIVSQGYTNVIAYKAPASGYVYIDDIRVWIANDGEGKQVEFAILDETGKILTNNGEKYVADSYSDDALAKEAAAEVSMIVTKQAIEKDEMIYFVFHGTKENTSTVRCTARIWFCETDGNIWKCVNENYHSSDMTLYSKDNWLSSKNDDAYVTPTQGLSLGDGLGAFYYQYSVPNTSDVDGIQVGDENEGIVTIYETPVKGASYCDKYITEVAADGTVSYIDLDMLNIKKQSKLNATDSTKIDVRYIASVDNLSYKSVGFVFSLKTAEPTIGGEACAQRELTKVYKRLLEGEGYRKAVNIYADDGCNTIYAYAFEILKTPADTIVYVRAYVELSDGRIVYGEPRAVTTTATGTVD